MMARVPKTEILAHPRTQAKLRGAATPTTALRTVAVEVTKITAAMLMVATVEEATLEVATVEVPANELILLYVGIHD